jgi:hypothetical protein
MAEKKTPPKWFQKVTWNEAQLDLSEFGWGTVTLKDAPYRRAQRWVGTDEKEPGDTTPTAILFQGYVRCGSDGRFPPEGANVTKWKEFLDDPGTPNKVPFRIHTGITWFAKMEQLDDGTLDDEPNGERPKSEVDEAGN